MANLIKGFFFDLDGTLVDTHEANYYAYQKAIKTVKNIDTTDELRSRIIRGESSKNFLPGVIEHITDEEIDRINQEKKQVYPEFLHHSTVNSFLTNFLAGLQDHYHAVLVTTAKKENALAVIKYHNIEHFFTDMIFGEDVETMKPAPDAYILALKRTGLEKDEVIAFEDSVNGLRAAELAGINAVHVRSFEK